MMPKPRYLSACIGKRDDRRAPADGPEREGETRPQRGCFELEGKGDGPLWGEPIAGLAEGETAGGKSASDRNVTHR